MTKISSEDYFSHDDIELLQERAMSSGFLSVKFIEATNPDLDFQVFYNKYIELKFNADLSYLNNLEGKFDVSHIFEPTSTIAVFALSYASEQTEVFMKNSEYRISRFALGIDYHSRMKDKIKNLLFGFEDYRIVVDTTPFPERYYARMAGIGFLGKNTMLIHLEQGSYFNLAFVLFKKELPENFQDNQKHSLITDDHEKYCDQCNKCVDACPGSALDGNGYLDANKCFSYWSIESRQSEIQLNSRMGNWVYGCDICQEVCPYNRDVPGKSTIDLYLHPASEIISHGIIPEKDVMKNSSFERVGIKGLERNFAFIHSIE